MYHISDDKRSNKSSIMIYDALVSLIDKMYYTKIKIMIILQQSEYLFLWVF